MSAGGDSPGTAETPLGLDSKSEPYGTFDTEEGGRPRKSSENYERLGNGNGDPPTLSEELTLNGRKLFVEFSGCLIFIYIGILQSLSGGGVTAAALAHGVTIAVLIMGLGHISGGHFNPAITLGILVSGNISLILSALYIVAQLLGGFVGALLARASITDELYLNINGGATLPPAAINGGQGIVMETILSFVLVMTVLVTAVDTNSNILAPLAIGLAITVDIFAGGNVTGASMNPARSLGPSIAASMFGVPDAWYMAYIYYVGPFLGGALAGVVYKYG